MVNEFIKIEWLKKAIIYQIFVGRWEGLVKNNEVVYIDNFKNLKRRNWQKIIRMGINTFYLLGVFDNKGPIIVGDENGKDLRDNKLPRLPSLFALSNHKGFNQNYGNEEDFRDLVNYFHELKAKVIVDFVPNHTAKSHPWVMEHPQYYVQTNGQFEAEFSGDVYKLNYQNQKLRMEMMGVLEWIANLGVDGVRCDMAHLIPDDFWKMSIEAIKGRFPQFVFVAEAYPNSVFDYGNIVAMYDSGFDVIYNNGLFNNFRKVVVNKEPVNYILECLKALRTNQPGGVVNYFFNHDDPVLDNKENNFEIDGLSYQFFEVLLGLTLFLPDIAFIYNGSLRGKVNRLAHHWFEPLEKKFLETENQILPETINLFEIRKNLDVEDIGMISDLRIINELLVFNKGKLMFVFNFTDEEKSLDFVRVNKVGLIHGLTNSSEIKPGKMEIFD